MNPNKVAIEFLKNGLPDMNTILFLLRTIQLRTIFLISPRQLLVFIFKILKTHCQHQICTFIINVESKYIILRIIQFHPNQSPNIILSKESIKCFLLGGLGYSKTVIVCIAQASIIFFFFLTCLENLIIGQIMNKDILAYVRKDLNRFGTKRTNNHKKQKSKCNDTILWLGEVQFE